jgi:hypothetical protein
MDNQLEPKDIFEDEFDSLPENIKEVLASPETATALEGLGKKFGIQLDQLDDLFEQVGFVLLGITLPRDFVTSLQSKLGLPREQVNQIAKEVNEKIFQPIRESLKEVHGEEGDLPTETLTEKVEPIISTSIPTPIPEQTVESFKNLGIDQINQTAGQAENPVPENLPIERDEILAAIENPEPQKSVTNQIAPQVTITTPEIITNTSQASVTPPLATEPPKTTPTDIFAGKLSSTVSIPDQKIDMSKDAVNKPTGSQYKVDPYREPIN